MNALATAMSFENLVKFSEIVASSATASVDELALTFFHRSQVLGRKIRSSFGQYRAAVKNSETVYSLAVIIYGSASSI
jgi:hypothetical protein